MISKKVMMVAGEASGDLHGAHLLEALCKIDPHVQCFGMGGDALHRAGMTLVYHHRAFSVVGITEVFLKLRVILKALRELKQSLDRERPDLVILVDFPDFNFRLAKAAHKRGIPVLYYISPQVWAWRPGRVKLISKWVRKMVVFFPFEVPIYRAAGVDVEWVGHPLLDIVRPSLSRKEALQKFNLSPDRPIVALLPGSRESEIEKLLSTLLASAEILQREIPTLQFVIPLASGMSREVLSPWVRESPIPVKVVEGLTYDVMNVADLLITASGTATLEGAILGRPMVIIYRVSPLSYWIGRMLVRVDHIGMVNLVAGKGLMPELLQKDANPERIAAESLPILKDPDLRRQMMEGTEEVRRNLGEPGAVGRAASIVHSLLNEARA
jgi:lipid-A-disaccharide synthase